MDAPWCVHTLIINMLHNVYSLNGYIMRIDSGILGLRQKREVYSVEVVHCHSPFWAP